MEESKENQQEVLKDNESYLIAEHIKFEIMVSENKEVWVKFIGFDDSEDAESYAEELGETLPLLLFESKRIH